MGENYFRRERYRASQRTEGYSDAERGEFYLPVLIHAIRPAELRQEPRIFSGCQWNCLPKNQIILDQNWALEAIYSIFHRDRCLKQLKKLHGRFSREDLELLVWSDFTHAEQEAFLGMSESCGICFKVRKLPNAEWEYIAPELLPKKTTSS